MDFIDKAIQQYAEQHTSPEPIHLYELNRYTHTNVLQPRMLSGHLQGRFLSFISCIAKPKYILDIGTYTGYSALCLAEGLVENGKVYSIEIDEEIAQTASNFINKSIYKNKIEISVGSALEKIKLLNEQVPYWDIVWIDAEKSEYIPYYDACIDKLKSGGIILADNVLWSGKVIDKQELLTNEETQLIHAFNQKIQQDTRVKNILLPLRDGIMMIEKL